MFDIIFDEKHVIFFLRIPAIIVDIPLRRRNRVGSRFYRQRMMLQKTQAEYIVEQLSKLKKKSIVNLNEHKADM